MRAARVASDFQSQYPDQFPANTRYTRARIKALNVTDNDIFAKTLKLTSLGDLLPNNEADCLRVYDALQTRKQLRMHF